jgi:hypothetical protein
MFVFHRFPKLWRQAAGSRVWTLIVVIAVGGSVLAAEPKSGGTAYVSGESKPTTEVDISGPYHAYLNGESYPSAVEIWGQEAMVKISIDGQDKPMIGTFLKDRLQVIFKYGAENFNLTTAVDAQFDGVSFRGKYARIDEKLGRKFSDIVLTPEWFGTGGGGGVVMPLPRQMSDVPGRYGMNLTTKDGRTVTANATMDVKDGTVQMSAGNRLYVCDFSSKEMAPLFWEGKRMDTFKLTPTESGFKGKLFKDIDGKQEELDVAMGKGNGSGGGGQDRDWTYVYDAIFPNQPIWIAKLTVHEQAAKLVIKIKGEKADMQGSLVENVLSTTGKYRNDAISIRAEKVRQGFSGVVRIGHGPAVREAPVVLKERPARSSAAATW